MFLLAFVNVPTSFIIIIFYFMNFIAWVDRIDQAVRNVSSAGACMAVDIAAADFAELRRQYGAFLVVLINLPWLVMQLLIFYYYLGFIFSTTTK